MDKSNFLEKLASQFGQNASVKNVFGDAVQVGNKTIIPVAIIAYGLGGGYGHEGKEKKPESVEPVSNISITAPQEGAGGGGGMYAIPKGVYEITPTSSRFIPANSRKMLLFGVAVGFILRGWLRNRQ